MAQLVEHILGKDEVTGSTPVSSSSEGAKVTLLHFFCKKIPLYALLLRFSQKVTQAELFASARFARSFPIPFLILKKGNKRFLSFCRIDINIVKLYTLISYSD